ncbi:ABC transporter permease [Lachnospiraceae bacterium ASD3451]|uniref:ABC transporter permease n=1 Tax=Diplocloster agilis TaxID=2850323 RepID=UPI001D4265D4|nr:ABC transporter permease [Diplocloster agilis]MBU9742352.1 ABC transporter permease [Diplocloster agilis]
MKKGKHLIQRGLILLLGNEKTQPITLPLFAVFLSLLLGMVIIAVTGANPVNAYQNLLQGCGILPKPSYAAYKNSFTDFTGFLNAWTPMLFASLAVAVALKAGMFNIGVSGQMLISGFMASILAGYADGLSGLTAKFLVLLVGIVVGMLSGGLVGWLKYRFRVNEVVSTIMLNYILLYAVSFCIHMWYINPVSRQSAPVTQASRLTLLDVSAGGMKIDIPLGILLAIGIAFLLRFLLNRTTFGFEIRAAGKSPEAARYAGMQVGKNMVLAMMLSGALSGLAGVTYYLGYFGSIRPKVLPAVGFDAIAVALLGNSNPAGVILSSFLISILEKGNTYMSSRSGVPGEIASVITGILLLVSACTGYIRYRINRLKECGPNTEEKGRKGRRGEQSV